MPEDAPSPPTSDGRQVRIVVVLCTLMLLAGYLLKAQCLNPWTEGLPYRRLCYNDLQPLYGIRGVQQHVFPYVSGALRGAELIGSGIEYPVLTGLFMWASGLPISPDDPAGTNNYLRLSALLLAPFGLLAAYLLVRMVGWRALLWAVGPPLIWYSFHNWDLLVVAAAVAGFWYWSRGQPTGAAVLFGIGGALKFYPLFFLAPLALEQWRKADWRRAGTVAATGALTFVVINLPFALANFDGWSGTYRFHQLRSPDFNSIWHWLGGWPQWANNLPLLTPEFTNRLTTVLIGASFVAALAVGWRRSARDGRYPFVQVSAAMLASFLLWNKVHSPQYALWILPFFALVNISVLWWAAYAAIDTVFYVGIFRWFYDAFERGLDYTPAKRALIFAIWGRAALLALLFVLFLRARLPDELEADTANEEAADAVVSHPLPTLGAVGEEPARG